MQLNKLEIKGFKSFGDKVIINFDLQSFSENLRKAIIPLLSNCSRIMVNFFLRILLEVVIPNL